jgi:hypothetical protein
LRNGYAKRRLFKRRNCKNKTYREIYDTSV